LGRLHVRIAVSEAAAWTARHWFGGHYRIIPNGVHTGPRRAVRLAQRRPRDRLRVVFVGQPVARKGLPVLLRAFQLLEGEMPVDLVLVGPSAAELPAALLNDPHVHALGMVDDETKLRQLERADVLCAPSVGGESFGMVITEAFASGTPVVASDIPGYRDLVRDGINGILVPPSDADGLAEALRRVWAEPQQVVSMTRAAGTDAERFAWPGVAARVLDAYRDAIAADTKTAGSPGRAIFRSRSAVPPMTLRLSAARIRQWL